MTRTGYIVLAAILALAGGCGGDDKKATTPDGGITDGGGKEGGSGGREGGGGAPDGGGEAGPTTLTLVDWVTDLVTNHSGAGDLPDSVDDKNIIDTTDPAAFDPLLSK